MKRALFHGQLHEARTLLDRLVEQDPLSPQTRGLELELLFHLGHYGEAEKLAQQLTRTFPDSSRIFFLAGLIAYKSKKYKDALGFFEESNRLYPHWKNERYIGKTQTQLGHFSQAESTLHPLRDRSPAIFGDLSWLYERTGDLEKARRLLEEQIRLQPDNTYATGRLAKLKASALDPEEVVAEMEGLLDMDEPLDQEMVGTYIRNLLKLGRVEKVREMIDTDAEQWQPTLRLDVAWQCHFNGLYDLSYALFLPELAHQCHNPKFLNALEKDAKLINRTEELIERYAELAKGQPRFYGRINRLRK